MTVKITSSSSEIFEELLSLTQQLRSERELIPNENPVLTLAQKIRQQLDTGRISKTNLIEIVHQLRDSSFLSHAKYLRKYLDIPDKEKIEKRIEKIIHDILTSLHDNPDESSKNQEITSQEKFKKFKQLIEKSKFAAVFTAHPTFSLANPVYTALADLSSYPITNETKVPFFTTHRRAAPPTLEEELQLAIDAITRGRNALDMFNRHLFMAARKNWPEQWMELTPCPILLSSWVGYDTDGRGDIGWWDSLYIRLHMKKLQLERLYEQLDAIPKGVDELKNRVSLALTQTRKQISLCPRKALPEEFSEFARNIIEHREEALLSAAQLAPLFEKTLLQVDESHKLDLLVARAGFMAHGLSLSHTQVRLNSSKIYNMARQRLGITNRPENHTNTRTLLNTLDAALDNVSEVPVDFGALLTEKASASILMMLLKQILKHIDNDTPIRFLIAETESGYTLLMALWLARLFGVEDKIEISPLFETDYALNHGDKIIEQALRSPHWRNYLKQSGKLCLQFGYSDSGRFIGQIAATYQIEKLRQKIAQLLIKYELTDVEVIMFDTHGESIGRGAHPFSMKERLQYLSPKVTELYFKKSGIQTRQETAFQGGDGYLLFGSQLLANATISIIAEHVYDYSMPEHDPIYDETAFNSDFFLTINHAMKELVNDKGYGVLLSTIGPAFIDKTGSRPAIRQSDASAKASIKHPKELRAIPNNAILQQLGWYANILQGLGSAMTTNPEIFEEMLKYSPRFRQSLDFAVQALKHSDPFVLRAIIHMLDPNLWLNRANQEKDPLIQKSYMELAQGLQKLNCWASTQATFYRIQKDHLALLSIWKDTPTMDTREILLHAIRLALIEKIWMLSTKIPYFSPCHGFTRENLDTKILCLEIPTVIEILSDAFPQSSEAVFDLYFYEPKGSRDEGAYTKDNQQIFQPMLEHFDLIREISIALIHRLHAFG